MSIKPDISTPLAALRSCLTLWSFLAEKPGVSLKSHVYNVLDWEEDIYYCPACEYGRQQIAEEGLPKANGERCGHCPLYPDLTPGTYYRCEAAEEPYYRWSMAHEAPARAEAAAEMCLLIKARIADLSEQEPT